MEVCQGLKRWVGEGGGGAKKRNMFASDLWTSRVPWGARGWQAKGCKCWPCVLPKCAALLPLCAATMCCHFVLSLCAGTMCRHIVPVLCAVRQELYSLSLFCPRLPLTSRPIYIRLQKNIHIHGSKIYIHPAHYHNGHALKSRGEFHQYVWADTQVETSGSSSVLTKKVSLSKNGR